MSIFLTGATGLLGRQLLPRLIEQGEHVVALIRAPNQEEATRRLRDVVHGAGNGTSDSVRACPGDVSLPGLGLSARDRDMVVSSCSEFIHAAADVRFDRSLRESWAVNVGGTEAIVELARARLQSGELKRVDYVSTAYVAGRRTDLVYEHDLDDRAGHRNSYEQSKFAAEKLLRSAMADLPITVFRPSIIVADAAPGRQDRVAIFWPIRTYTSGVWRICPGRRETPIDLIPVDTVASTLLAIREEPQSVGGTFHLTAGRQGASTLGHLVDIVQEIFPGRRPVRFVEPSLWMSWIHPLIKHLTVGRTRRAIRAGEFYVPYLVANPEFDNSGTLAVTLRRGLKIPPVEDYIRRILRDYRVALEAR
jgi:long-chain acyl-CoA synthetase